MGSSLGADEDCIHLLVLTESVIVETPQGCLELTPRQVRGLAALMERLVEYDPALKPTDADRNEVTNANFEKGGDA